MASKEGGGGGALGWTLLGFLAGVAATLALQTLLLGGSHDRIPLPQASITHATVIQADTSQPKSVVHPVKAEASLSAAPSAAVAAAQPRDEVADDAAATGMTSRVQPPADDGAARN